MRMRFEMPEVSLMARHESESGAVVRDALMRCLAAEHGTLFAEQQRAVGLDGSDQAVAGSIEGMVRLAFQQVGGDFDHPTMASLIRVTNLLAERSLQWGASEDTVFACHTDLTRRIGMLS
jgi:hypothetical protein